MLISNPVTCHHRKSYIIKLKLESFLKIQHYCIKNNVSVEAPCWNYGINRRYYIYLMMQLNLLPDCVVSNLLNNHSGQPWSLQPITNELLWYVFVLHEDGIVESSCMVCCISMNWNVYQSLDNTPPLVKRKSLFF